MVEGEDVTRMSHPKVLKMIEDGPLSSRWGQALEEILVLAREGDRKGVIRHLHLLVSWYKPDYAFHETLVSPDTSPVSPLPPSPRIIN